MDEQALFAGAAYVDLNPVRAAMAETLKHSHHASAQRRIEAVADGSGEWPQMNTEKND